MARATEEDFSELHGLIKNGDATTQDLKAAADWLSKNNITGVPTLGSPLATLFASMPELELEDVQSAIR